MDSERRHQLRENDLAHGLTVTRDFFEQHSKQITLAAATVLGLFLIASLVIRSRETAHQDIWRQKNELTFDDPKQSLHSVDQLLTLAKESSDRRFALDALIQAGRESLRLAKEAPFPPDKEFNARARMAFEELLKRYPGDGLPVGVSLAGLATVEENEFVLDHNAAHKDKAKEYLTRLSSDSKFSGLPFQRMALDRLKALDSIFVVTEFAPAPLPPPVEAAAPVEPAPIDPNQPVKIEPVKVEPPAQP